MSKHSPALYAQRYFTLRQAALPYGVTVAQENISRCKSGDLSFLAALSDELGDDISFVFDLKQALRSGYAPEDVLRVMGKRIIHVHANDHTAEQDCLLPGKGSYDFAGLYRYFRENEMEPTTVIEVYRYNFEAGEELLASLNYLHSVCE